MKRQPRTLAEFFDRRDAPTQDAIAKRLNITAAYVSLLASEKRQPSIDLALRIEAETGVTLPVLLSVRAAVAS